MEKENKKTKNIAGAIKVQRCGREHDHTAQCDGRQHLTWLQYVFFFHHL